MKIYTRTGDAGETALFGGGRVPKDHVRVQAYGTVDELNAFLGLAVSAGLDAQTVERIVMVQRDLMAVAAHLATPPEGATDRPRPELPPVPSERIEEMEGWIDESWEETPPLRNFILPGRTPGASALHVARVVCRRAERAVVSLGAVESVDEEILRYLNRLSDLLFAVARLENYRSGAEETVWDPGASKR